MNALEDDAPGHLWQWELRDLKVQWDAGRNLQSGCSVARALAALLPRLLAVWGCRPPFFVSLPRYVVHPASPPAPATPQVLPKEARPAAQAAKRRAAHVQERLGAVSAALHLLGGHPGGKASAKLAKALDALQKAKVGGWVRCRTLLTWKFCCN